MNQTLSLGPGIRLRCIPDSRFKQGCLSLQLVRPMCREEASCNALLPAVLLRGTREYPDLRAITLRLDDLYGASVGTLVRRVGDYQTTGFYCGFMEDRFALEGDAILEPMLEEINIEPYLDGVEQVCIGGESGAGARMMRWSWAESIRRQCDRHGVPLYLHQTGAVLEKDGRVYHIPRKLQHEQARKSGLSTVYGASDHEAT